MTSKSFESGIRPYRLEYIRENTFEEPNSNPSWNLFSDAVQSFDPGISPGVEGQRALGDPDFVAHNTVYMDAEPSVTYHLQQKTSSGDTLVTSGGNNNDALTDGLERDSDNRLANSHHIVRRMTQSDLDAGNTVNGSTSLDTRKYLVYRGALVDEATVEVDPSGGQPITVTLDYVARKAEVHQLDQPSSSTTIDVVSNNSNDSGSVTLENEGAGTTESVSITANGTTTSTNSFGDLDVVELDSEQPGDITISDGTNDLMVIPGQNSHDHGEGSLGIPALGSGSHASSIGQAYEFPQATTIEQPSSKTLADEIISAEVTISNNVTNERSTTGPRPVVAAAERTPEATATVAGEREYFTHVRDALQAVTENFLVTLNGSDEDIQLDSAATADVGKTEDVGQGVPQVDVTLEGEGVTVNS